MTLNIIRPCSQEFLIGNRKKLACSVYAKHYSGPMKIFHLLNAVVSLVGPRSIIVEFPEPLARTTSVHHAWNPPVPPRGGHDNVRHVIFYFEPSENVWEIEIAIERKMRREGYPLCRWSRLGRDIPIRIGEFQKSFSRHFPRPDP